MAHDPQSPAENPEDIETIEAVATAYRRLVVWFGLYYLLPFTVAWVVTMLVSAAVAKVLVSAAVAKVLVPLVALIAYVALVCTAYRLAGLLGLPRPWVYILAMLLPCINIIGLLDLSHRANTWLTPRGVKVGLLGPSRQSIERLRAERAGEEDRGPPPAAG
jgi:hypothetical protein